MVEIRMKSFFVLTKIVLSIQVALTALFGAAAALRTNWFDAPSLSPLNFFFLFAGVLAFAMAANTCNQLMEIDIDRIRARTAQRPLVTGALTPLTARICSGLLLSVGGLALLALPLRGLESLALSLVAFAVYILLYTPLKRMTTFSILPGALSGALPIVIGWRAAGGSYEAYPLYFLLALMLVWQIPHTWILQQKYSAQDLAARLATFPSLLANPVLKRLIALWGVLLALCTLWLLHPVFRFNGIPSLIPLVATLFLLLQSLRLLTRHSGTEKQFFMSLNLALLAVMGAFLFG